MHESRTIHMHILQSCSIYYARRVYLRNEHHTTNTTYVISGAGTA
jgi:hypothetical protein